MAVQADSYSLQERNICCSISLALFCSWNKSICIFKVEGVWLKCVHTYFSIFMIWNGPEMVLPPSKPPCVPVPCRQNLMLHILLSCSEVNYAHIIVKCKVPYPSSSTVGPSHQMASAVNCRLAPWQIDNQRTDLMVPVTQSRLLSIGKYASGYLTSKTSAR